MSDDGAPHRVEDVVKAAIHNLSQANEAAWREREAAKPKPPEEPRQTTHPTRSLSKRQSAESQQYPSNQEAEAMTTVPIQLVSKKWEYAILTVKKYREWVNPPDYISEVSVILTQKGGTETLLDHEEYSTPSDLAMIQVTTLNNLGEQGWEVFTTERANAGFSSNAGFGGMVSNWVTKTYTLKRPLKE